MEEGQQSTTRPALDDGTVRRLLEIERAGLAGLIAGLEHEGMAQEEQSEAMGELTPVSQHPADVGSDTFERERDLGLLEDFRAELEEVSQALIRLSHGVYGICEGCRVAIDPERLEAVPSTRFCRPCEERYEHGGGLLGRVDRPRSESTSDLSEFLPRDDDLDGDMDEDDLGSAEEAAMRLVDGERAGPEATIDGGTPTPERSSAQHFLVRRRARS